MEDTKLEIDKLRKKPGWTLRREKKQLVLKLKDLDETTDEYKACLNAIAAIDKVFNERANTWSNVGKVAGMTGITIAGLFLTYSIGDKGDMLPNKNTSRFTDNLMGFFRK